MVLQADSVQVEAAEEESLQNPVVHTGELTPRKVLSWLPRNATPAKTKHSNNSDVTKLSPETEYGTGSPETPIRPPRNSG